MKNKLKKITDNTVNDLLQNEIILPSQYFQTFDRHAKLLDTDIRDESFEQEVNEVIVKEFETINGYMTKTEENIEKLSNATKDAKTAIKNRDEAELTKVYKEIQNLQKEIALLQTEMYVDSLTKTLNKKWIYSQFVDIDGNIQSNGVMVLINISDYNYIRETHGDLIGDNLIKFLADYINKHIKNEGSKFKIARYSANMFLLFFDELKINEVRVLINNIQKGLLNTTLKSKSGIMLQTSFYYTLTQYKNEDSFQSVLEMLTTKIKEMS